MPNYPKFLRWPNGRAQAAFGERDERLMRGHGCVDFEAPTVAQPAVAVVPPHDSAVVGASPEPKRRGRPPKARP